MILYVPWLLQVLDNMRDTIAYISMRRLKPLIGFILSIPLYLILNLDSLVAFFFFSIFYIILYFSDFWRSDCSIPKNDAFYPQRINNHFQQIKEVLLKKYWWNLYLTHISAVIFNSLPLTILAIKQGTKKI